MVDLILLVLAASWSVLVAMAPYLLLGFFVWAIWFAMDPRGVASFLESPYAKVVDAKMWLFFAPPSRLTVAVVGVLVEVPVMLSLVALANRARAKFA